MENPRVTLLHPLAIWERRECCGLVIRKMPRERGEGQGIGGVPLETFEEGPPLKPVQKMALILELAAMFVATLIGAVLFPRSETAWLDTSVPLVPLVWYAIGRWLNGLLGYSAPASALEHRHLFVLGLADACHRADQLSNK